MLIKTNSNSYFQIPFILYLVLVFIYWRKSIHLSMKRLSPQSKKVLTRWFVEHRFHPYPTQDEKLELSKMTNLQIVQIENWFINYRRRNQVQSDTVNKRKRTPKETNKKRNKKESPENLVFQPCHENPLHLFCSPSAELLGRLYLLKNRLDELIENK